MSSDSSNQLELLGPAAPRPSSRGARLLGIVLDRMTFLQFLGSEWLYPTDAQQLLLGTERPCATQIPTDVAVAVWFDSQSLPDITVMAWRDGAWNELTLSDLRKADLVVSWNGPLPGFAVHHFEVSSESAKTQLLAMARNFADMDVPSQPFEVGPVSHVEPPLDSPPSSSSLQPPKNWDSLRGAATMAAFAVPAIDPWVELLCQSLSNEVAVSENAERLHAPWWRVPLWFCSDDRQQQELPALWRAIVAELSQQGRLREWRAKSILESICDQARLLGEEERRLTHLKAGAMGLLDDSGTIEELGSKDDNLALTLQLLLLRPSPEKFISWREDWPAIPPVAWWTGMTLAGYLQGYQALPKQFRGTIESRKLLSLKTWQLACGGSSWPWRSVTPERVDWFVEGDAILLMADAQPWAEHKLGTRGRWYRADFDQRETHVEAKQLAQQACPESMLQLLTLSDVNIPFSGDGIIKVDAEQRLLNVKGCVELPLGQGVTIERRLDVARFQDWLATASITQRIGRPPGVSHEVLPRPAGNAMPTENSPHKRISSKGNTKREPAKNPTSRAKVGTQNVFAPRGLKLLPDFISSEEEATLIATIDSLEWDRSMKRRVQHYGWRYGYKDRKVDPASRIGPLPGWAQNLAERLLEYEVVSELPDQVIVNNYDGRQGITKHIDCPNCFRGPVVTISLLETWDMVFTRKMRDGESLRFVQALPPRSAAVLDGEARSVWYHEIPARLAEHGAPRVRRVSITFRRVAV